MPSETWSSQSACESISILRRAIVFEYIPSMSKKWKSIENPAKLALNSKPAHQKQINSVQKLFEGPERRFSTYYDDVRSPKVTLGGVSRARCVVGTPKTDAIECRVLKNGRLLKRSETLAGNGRCIKITDTHPKTTDMPI